jgi:predicted Rossmann fold nucleotide-binding protein DprA/Smf involved in DNA uptake
MSSRKAHPNIVRIGIVGSREYENRRKIKDTIYKLNMKFGSGNVEIVSGGCPHGADKYAKKYALELECHYKEFNPSHTPKNFYSAMPDGFYEKQYNPKNFFHRNKFLAKYVDYLIAFVPEGIKSSGTMHTVKQAKTFGKNVIIIT